MMKIYDISQKIFGCEVYPGDPEPEKKVLKSMDKGEVYNLTAFNMCAHNGTHVDAPFHFINDGKKLDEIDLEAFVGMAYVAEHNGVVTGNDAENAYPETEKPVNTRSSKTEMIGTNGVHPTYEGYMQIADAAFRNMVHYIAKE